MLQSCGKNGSAWDRSQSHPSLVSLETSKRNKEASRWEPTANSFFMLSVSGMLITTKHFKEIQGAFAPIGWGRRKTHRCAVHTQPPPPLQSLEHQGTHIWFCLVLLSPDKKAVWRENLAKIFGCNFSISDWFNFHTQLMSMIVPPGCMVNFNEYPTESKSAKCFVRKLFDNPFFGLAEHTFLCLCLCGVFSLLSLLYLLISSADDSELPQTTPKYKRYTW